MHWYRAHHGAPFDTKLALVAKRANVTRGHAASVWWAVLDFASQANPRGSVAGIDPEEIAAAFDYDEQDVSRVLDAMRHKGLLIDGQEELTGWNKGKFYGRTMEQRNASGTSGHATGQSRHAMSRSVTHQKREE